MGIKKKKREQRRKIKAEKKLLKGRDVYFPVLELRLVDFVRFIPAKTDSTEITDV